MSPATARPRSLIRAASAESSVSWAYGDGQMWENFFLMFIKAQNILQVAQAARSAAAALRAVPALHAERRMTSSDSSPTTSTSTKAVSATFVVTWRAL